MLKGAARTCALAPGAQTDLTPAREAASHTVELAAYWDTLVRGAAVSHGRRVRSHAPRGRIPLIKTRYLSSLYLHFGLRRRGQTCDYGLRRLHWPSSVRCSRANSSARHRCPISSIASCRITSGSPNAKPRTMCQPCSPTRSARCFGSSRCAGPTSPSLLRPRVSAFASITNSAYSNPQPPPWGRSSSTVPTPLERSDSTWGRRISSPG